MDFSSRLVFIPRHFLTLKSIIQQWYVTYYTCIQPGRIGFPVQKFRYERKSKIELNKKKTFASF